MCRPSWPTWQTWTFRPAARRDRFELRLAPCGRPRQAAAARAGTSPAGPWRAPRGRRHDDRPGGRRRRTARSSSAKSAACCARGRPGCGGSPRTRCDSDCAPVPSSPSRSPPGTNCSRAPASPSSRAATSSPRPSSSAGTAKRPLVASSPAECRVRGVNRASSARLAARSCWWEPARVPHCRSARTVSLSPNGSRPSRRWPYRWQCLPPPAHGSSRQKPPTA